MKNRLLIWLIAAGLGIAYLGIMYQNPIVSGLFIGGAGVFSIFSGFQMMISRRAEVPTGDISPHIEHHTGLAAQFWGFLYMVFGAIAILIALAMSVFRESVPGWVESLFERSSGIGWLMIVAGGMVRGYPSHFRECTVYRDKISPFRARHRRDLLFTSGIGGFLDRPVAHPIAVHFAITF